MILQYQEPDLSNVYLAYTAEGAEMAMKKSSKGKSKTGSRPKTGKKKRQEAEIYD